MFLSLPYFFEKAYPPSCLRLTKNLPNIVPLVDKIDTDKDIGRVQVPLLLRLRPFIVIDIKMTNYQFDMIVTSKLLLPIRKALRISNRQISFILSLSLSIRKVL